MSDLNLVNTLANCTFDEVLQVKKLDKNAKLPTRGTELSAGYDLYALNSGCIKPKSKALIGTGIAIRLPQISNTLKVYGSIRSRSGLSIKHSLEVGAGVIDLDYSKEVGVILYNHGDMPFEYNAHERIAQLILEVHLTPEVKEVEELSAVNSNRKGGYGSTGK